PKARRVCERGLAGRGEPMIKVERLVKAFGRQQVLRGLDLDVATGSITVVIGRSGGGKSVLLRHLIGLLRPDAGRVLVDGALVTEPEIVFFDEPTTGLDPILVNTIHHLILELHRKLRFTAVMVSHEIPEIFEIADTVAMLHEGRIAEVGPPAVIQASPNPVV